MPNQPNPAAVPPAPAAAPPLPGNGWVPPSAGGFNAPPEAPHSKGINKNIILMGILILFLVVAVFGFYKARSLLSSASEGGCTPAGLEETNLTPNSVEIIFETGKACQTEVAYGTSNAALLLQVPEAMAALNHRIRLAPLLPGTTYYYQVTSGGKDVGTQRSFLTKAVPSPTAAPQPTASASPSGVYTIGDFQKEFGSTNAVFDIDKNGIVNVGDWLLYQKSD